MIPFKAFLAEIFQQHHPFEYHGGSEHGTHRYSFKTEKGHHYHVYFSHGGSPETTRGHNPHHAEVDFGQQERGVPKTHVTGDQREGSHKIFSTVHHIITHHIEKHPEVKHLHFTADEKEPTRVKLYQHFAKRLHHKVTQKSDSETHRFHIHIGKSK